MNRYSQQFVRFNYIGSLNEWLRKYSHLILIEDYQVINMNNELTYIVRFSLKASANTLATKRNAPISYEQ